MKDSNFELSPFPKDFRKKLSKLIYEQLESDMLSKQEIINLLIYSLINPDSEDSIIKEYKNPFIKNININFENSINYRTALIYYLDDLLYIISKIKFLNDTNQPINFTKLITEIIDDKKNINLKRRGLEVALSEIYNHLKNNVQGFTLNRAKRKSREGSESEKESVRCYIKEYRLLTEMYNGRFGGICFMPDCDIDFRKLPVFEFHHLDPKLKRSTWNELMHKEYTYIKNELESQNVIIICANCHLYKTANIYRSFEDVIMQKDLLKLTPNDIESLIDNRLKDKKKKSYLKFEIKRWIKKRAAFEQLYQARCIGCGESRLPALHAHHTNSKLKTKKWGEISRKWNTKRLIYDFLIKEECICLCANCHYMLTRTNFEKNVRYILGENYILEEKMFFENLRKNIIKSAKRIRIIKNCTDT